MSEAIGETHHVNISALACGDCDRALVPHRSHPRGDGVRPKLLLLCPGCGKGILVKGVIEFCLFEVTRGLESC